MYKRIIFGVICICIGVSLSGCKKDEEPTTVLQTITEEEAQDEEQKECVCVHVCGAVKKQGVYELEVGSRVYEAIEMAGGFLKTADITGINQAEVLEDEMQLYIPTREEGALKKEKEDGKVNLNTATKEELMTLSGVGESKAESIVHYRQENGKFKKIEDIMKISGIKEGLFQKIKEDITI